MGGKSDNRVEETPEQQELAKLAAEKWNYSQNNLAPLMSQYMEKTDNMAKDGALGYQRGRANEEAQIIQNQQQQQVDQGLQASGVDPSSGRAQMTHSQLGIAQSEAAGEASGRAQNEQLNQHVMGLQNITAIGQGQSGRAQAGIGQLAAASAQNQQQDAFNTFNRRSANMQLVGAIGGAGASYGIQQTTKSTPGDSSHLMMKSAQNETAPVGQPLQFSVFGE